MVIAHAVVAAESGHSVTILIDDGPGATIATSEIGRLRRLGTSGHPVGSITLANTLPNKYSYEPSSHSAALPRRMSILAGGRSLAIVTFGLRSPASNKTLCQSLPPGHCVRG
jgi:hypothetical protein